MLWAWVAVRVLVNPLSNVFQKLLAGRGLSPLAVVAVTHGVLAVVALPLLAVHPPPASAAFWADIAASAALAVAGNAMLVKAVHTSDLSVLGPVNAYKAVVSLLPGLALLNEIPSVAALAGVGLILVGSYAVAGRRPAGPPRGAFARLWADRGVQFRLAAMVLSAVEAVFLKRALLASAAVPTFAVWALLGFAFSAPVAARFRAREAAAVVTEARRSIPTCLLLGVSTGLMQFGTVVVFGEFPVAAALALFQTSALVSVLLGWRVFGEPDVVKRLLGSAVMAAGAALIVTTR